MAAPALAQDQLEADNNTGTTAGTRLGPREREERGVGSRIDALEGLGTLVFYVVVSEGRKTS